MIPLRKIVSTGVWLSLGLAFSTPLLAQTDGAALFAAKGCIGCHGVDGNTPLTPAYPKVARQNRQYIINQLNDFKAGKRMNGQSAVMLGMVAALSDEDIAALADFLSAEPAGGQ